MKEILIIGFGGIGSRHCESLLNITDFNISIIEPNLDNFKFNSESIGLKSTHNVHYFSSLDSFNKKKVDLIIHATSADIRLESLKEIKERIDCDYYLIEKIVFQNISSFNAFDKIEIENKISSFVHLPMRYYNSTQSLKNIININKINIESISVKGYQWGVLCNLIHYLDYLYYLFAIKLDFKASEIHNARIIDSKRLGGFKELSGSLSLRNSQNISLHLLDEINEDFEIKIVCSNQKIIIVNNLGVYYDEKLITNIFRQYTSELTSIVVSDIFNSKSILPTLKETINYHNIVFEIFKNISNQNPQNIPIT